MSLETKEINSVKIIFDKEKTKAKAYRAYSCGCQDCRNFYKNIENNTELVAFLNDFGIVYNCDDEVFSRDWGNDKNSLIHYEGYYGVWGRIEGGDFDYENFGVKISFQKDPSLPYDRPDECFWIRIEGDFPYLLEEERELPITFSQKILELDIVTKIKTILKKK
mgnify:CR=1 FL=1